MKKKVIFCVFLFSFAIGFYISVKNYNLILHFLIKQRLMGIPGIENFHISFKNVSFSLFPPKISIFSFSLKDEKISLFIKKTEIFLKTKGIIPYIDKVYIKNPTLDLKRKPPEFYTKVQKKLRDIKLPISWTGGKLILSFFQKKPLIITNLEGRFEEGEVFFEGLWKDIKIKGNLKPKDGIFLVNAFVKELDLGEFKGFVHSSANYSPPPRGFLIQSKLSLLLKDRKISIEAKGIYLIKKLKIPFYINVTYPEGGKLSLRFCLFDKKITGEVSSGRVPKSHTLALGGEQWARASSPHDFWSRHLLGFEGVLNSKINNLKISNIHIIWGNLKLEENNLTASANIFLFDKYATVSIKADLKQTQANINLIEGKDIYDIKLKWGGDKVFLETNQVKIWLGDFIFEEDKIRFLILKAESERFGELSGVCSVNLKDKVIKIDNLKSKFFEGTAYISPKRAKFELRRIIYPSYLEAEDISFDFKREEIWVATASCSNLRFKKHNLKDAFVVLKFDKDIIYLEYLYAKKQEGGNLKLKDVFIDSKKIQGFGKLQDYIHLSRNINCDFEFLIDISNFPSVKGKVKIPNYNDPTIIIKDAAIDIINQDNLVFFAKSLNWREYKLYSPKFLFFNDGEVIRFSQVDFCKISAPSIEGEISMEGEFSLYPMYYKVRAIAQNAILQDKPKDKKIETQQIIKRPQLKEGEFTLVLAKDVEYKYKYLNFKLQEGSKLIFKRQADIYLIEGRLKISQEGIRYFASDFYVQEITINTLRSKDESSISLKFLVSEKGKLPQWIEYKENILVGEGETSIGLISVALNNFLSQHLDLLQRVKREIKRVFDIQVISKVGFFERILYERPRYLEVELSKELSKRLNYRYKFYLPALEDKSPYGELEYFVDKDTTVALRHERGNYSILFKRTFRF